VREASLENYFIRKVKAAGGARCANWAGMGMGKTTAMLTLLHTLQLLEPGPGSGARAAARGALHVAEPRPRSGSTSPNLEVVPIVGTEAERIAALKRDASTYTINYDVLPWLIEYHLANKLKWRWSRVVADESTRLKNFRLRNGGRRAQAIGRVAHTRVRRWINLTGTPSPNGLIDLWGQTWFLDAGVRLGRTIHGVPPALVRLRPVQREVTPQALRRAQIHEQLRDICMTLDPKDYFDVSEAARAPGVRRSAGEGPALPRDGARDVRRDQRAIEVEAFTRGREVDQVPAARERRGLRRGHSGAGPRSTTSSCRRSSRSSRRRPACRCSWPTTSRATSPVSSRPSLVRDT
jgi:hypothetical protein